MDRLDQFVHVLIKIFNYSYVLTCFQRGHVNNKTFTFFERAPGRTRVLLTQREYISLNNVL